MASSTVDGRAVYMENGSSAYVKQGQKEGTPQNSDTVPVHVQTNCHRLYPADVPTAELSFDCSDDSKEPHPEPLVSSGLQV